MARVGEEVDVLRARPRHPRPRLAGVRETLPPVPGGGTLEHGHTGSTIIHKTNHSFPKPCFALKRKTFVEQKAQLTILSEYV